jgi:hypothetical protein
MKTRNGFVSNSSSSSFVVVIPTDIAETVLQTLTPYEQAVAKHVRLSDKKFMGGKVAIFQGSTGNNDVWEYGFDFEGDKSDEDNTYDAWQTFLTKVKETGEDHFLISETDS